MAFVDTVFYVNYGDGSTTGYFSIAKWATGHAYSAGNIVRQNTAPTIGNERVFACIVAGTSNATTEPTWTVTRGAKTTDNTVTWIEMTGVAGVNGDLTNCPTWTTVKGTSVSLGQVIQRNNGASLQICTTAGTAGSGSEPSFSNTAGTTTSDNTVTWTSLGVVGNWGAWAAPFPRLSIPASGSTWVNTSSFGIQTIYVGDNHAESSTGAISITPTTTSGRPLNVLCVDHTAAVPPSGSSALKTTATITSSAASGFTIGSSSTTLVYFYGISFIQTATSLANAFFIMDVNGGYAKFEQCTFYINNSSNTSGTVIFGSNASGAASVVELFMCSLHFTNVSQSVVVTGVALLWRGGSLLGTGPTTLLAGGSTDPSETVIEGVDLSTVTSKLAGFTSSDQYLLVKDCKLGSGVTATSTSVTGTIDIVNSDSGATNYRVERHAVGGDLTTSTNVARTGGFSIEGTALSHEIVTASGATWPFPFWAPVIFIRNGSTAANVNVTLYGVINAAAVPNNDDFWFDVEYLGSSGNPQGSYALGSKSNYLASNAALSADSTSAWDSAATARANTHTYSVGDVIKLASSPGRVFFCTTGGTSAGSEPGGYASAVDGGSVTDSGAVFRAGCRFSLTVAITSPQPQLAGLLTIYPKMAKASSTLYFDPLPVLS